MTINYNFSWLCLLLFFYQIVVKMISVLLNHTKKNIVPMIRVFGFTYQSQQSFLHN
ncbi:hypothetical protein CPARA_2gp310 (nucleomorph) [Cryptomonas paramecium]|uniref:Uncharacterized protein n=1 Tax=Cryptomonas paramaecium TaxID=2898 RepID=F2HI22_9CRYP|nr:hypothetical protein CPARA_2gp310 [Cryptomonas paramecium]AEA38968.1 hypothetical protein CPARA_2gp310 [Cryptomonas paramecium]